MAFVNGHHSLAHVKRIVEKLRSNELDGIVCVNMFGEGFNLPNLKIAAVHSPHKSLAITLQFIGRFARTGQQNIGGATFLAEPISSGAEIDELYEAGAIWRDIVQNLGAGRVERKCRRARCWTAFEIDASPDMGDFSLYTVRPYFHAKVFAAPDGVDLTAEPDLPEKLANHLQRRERSTRRGRLPDTPSGTLSVVLPMSASRMSPTTCLFFITTRLPTSSSFVHPAGTRSSIPGLQRGLVPGGPAPCPTAALIAS